MGAGLPVAAALTFTLPGAPMIFQGQEVRSIKALKPYDDDGGIVWPKTLPTDFATYAKLIKLRNQNAALFAGSAGGDAVSLTVSTAGLMAFKRTSGTNTVWVVVNLSKKAITGTWNPGSAATLYAFSSNKAVKVVATKQAITLPAFGYEIYTKAVVK